MTRLIVLVIAGAAMAPAQLISPGFRLGSVLTDTLETGGGRASYRADNQHFIYGPSVEIRLPLLFAIEVDALYRNWDYRLSGGSTNALIAGKGSANGWEFPVLAKFRAPIPIVKPFVSGGMSFRTVTSSSYSVACTGSLCGSGATTTNSDPPELKDHSNSGIVLGAGADIKIKLRFTPEIRYTRWFQQEFSVEGLRSNQNQLMLLFGISF
jgi:opacity protein-like surface antigen